MPEASKATLRPTCLVTLPRVLPGPRVSISCHQWVTLNFLGFVLTLYIFASSSLWEASVVSRQHQYGKSKNKLLLGSSSQLSHFGKKKPPFSTPNFYAWEVSSALPTSLQWATVACGVLCPKCLPQYLEHSGHLLISDAWIKEQKMEEPMNEWTNVVKLLSLINSFPTPS